MSSPSNEYAYAKQFNGNLRTGSDPVPVQVTTRLRVMPDQTAAEIRKYSHRAFDAPPQYRFGGGDLPVHPSLQAFGRHYFTW
jgi:hypothetical protein